MGDMIPLQARDMRLLTRMEVARIFRVDPKTVTRWATQGRLPSVRTPGGHRRYPETAVLRMLAEVEAAEGVPA